MSDVHRWSCGEPIAANSLFLWMYLQEIAHPPQSPPDTSIKLQAFIRCGCVVSCLWSSLDTILETDLLAKLLVSYSSHSPFRSLIALCKINFPEKICYLTNPMLLCCYQLNDFTHGHILWQKTGTKFGVKKHKRWQNQYWGNNFIR